MIPLSELSDESLIERIRERDHAGFHALFDRYHARLFSFVERRLSDRELSEEVVADAFFEVWRGAPGFRGASRVSTWVFGIATFKCREADRNRRRLKRASVTPMETSFLHGIPDDQALLDRLEARSDLRWLGERFQTLPAPQREVTELAGQGRSTDEIAGRLGVSNGTVKSRLSRARRALRTPPPGARGEGR